MTVRYILAESWAEALSRIAHERVVLYGSKQHAERATNLKSMKAFKITIEES